MNKQYADLLEKLRADAKWMLGPESHRYRAEDILFNARAMARRLQELDNLGAILSIPTNSDRVALSTELSALVAWQETRRRTAVGGHIDHWEVVNNRIKKILNLLAGPDDTPSLVPTW